MSDFGLGNTVKAVPIDSDQDNVTHVEEWEGQSLGRTISIGPKGWNRFENGQFAPKTEPTPSVLVTPEDSMTQLELTPQEVNHNVGAFMSTLQYMANSVVKASEFAQELKALRAEFDALRTQVEVYRATNARLDEEVTNLRQERTKLQDENSALQIEKRELAESLNSSTASYDRILADRDRIQSEWITQNDQLREMKVNLSDEQRKVRELEDQVRWLTMERDKWLETANTSQATLSRIRQEVADIASNIAA